MMARVLRSLALCAVVLAGFALPQAGTAQTFTIAATRAETQLTVPRSLNTKFPGVAGLGNQVVAVANSRADATAWQKQDTADSFGGSLTLGDADGQSDYTSVGAGANKTSNTFYAIWTNQDTDEVRFATKARDAATWSESRRIARVDFPHFARIAANGNTVMAVWREVNRDNDGKIVYRYSTDNGATWSGGRVSSRSTLTNADVAVNESGQYVVSYADTAGDVFLALFNGSSFNIETVQNDSGYYSQADTGIGPDGRISVLFREEGRGVYIRDRQANGTWNPTARLVAAGGRNVVRLGVALEIDSAGNTYVNWISTADGDEDAYFTFRGATATSFEGIVKLEGPGALYNGSNGVTLNTRGYSHYVAEYFAGADLVTRYFRFSSDATGGCSGTIAFASNAEVTNQRTISGSITPSAGCTPSQARVQLNTQDDNAPLAPYASAFSLTVPDAAIAQCTQTVNVKLVQNGTAGQWFSKAIKVDPGDVQNPVTAVVGLEPTTITKDIAANGPSSGDANYTREPQVRLNIRDAGDCSGLNTFSAVDQNNVPIPAGGIAQTIGLPGTGGQAIPPAGRVEVPVNVVDKAGNLQTFRPSIIYDPADLPNNPGGGRPVWSSGSTSTASNETTSILRTIAFSGVKVTDNLYNNGTPSNTTDDFWGVWVASEYLGAAGTTPPAVNPANTALYWVPIKVSERTCAAGSGCSFTVPVNLFSGLGFGPDTSKAGSYRVYVKILDGAGNDSALTETATFTLDAGYTLPTTLLSVIRK